MVLNLEKCITRLKLNGSHLFDYLVAHDLNHIIYHLSNLQREEVTSAVTKLPLLPGVVNSISLMRMQMIHLNREPMPLTA